MTALELGPIPIKSIRWTDPVCTALSDWTEKEDDDLHLKWISDAYELVYRRWGGVPNPFKGPPMDMSKPPNESPFEGCYYSADPPPSNLLRSI